MSKRPWKKHACIERVELNNGDVKFVAMTCEMPSKPTGDERLAKIGTTVAIESATFEDLQSAEGHLDAWWAGWWPVQVKSTKRA